MFFFIDLCPGLWKYHEFLTLHGFCLIKQGNNCFNNLIILLYIRLIPDDLQKQMLKCCEMDQKVHQMYNLKCISMVRAQYMR